MGKIYARTILRGTRSLADVPQTWLGATMDALQDLCDTETFERLVTEAGFTVEPVAD